MFMVMPGRGPVLPWPAAKSRSVRLLAAARLFLQLVDPLRRLRLGELVEIFGALRKAGSPQQVRTTANSEPSDMTGLAPLPE
jgi:hypothetical protein